MALGILSVSAGLDGDRMFSVALLGMAVLTFVALLPVVVRSKPSRLEATYIWLTCAAACGVLAERLGPSLWPAALLLAALAVVAWTAGEVLFVRLLAGWRGDWRRWEVGGSWLLAVVATQSVSIVAGNVGGRGWTVVAGSLWVLGASMYVALIALIVRRILRHEIGPERHTPDYWISMGGLAITSVAALDLANVLPGAGARHLFVGLGIAALIAAAAWIPYLVAMEVVLVRLGSFQRAYDALRWSTVFPLGMLSVAVYEVGGATGTTGFLVYGRASFWAGIAFALLNVSMLVLRNA